MIAEIIATGDEIRTGALVDSNSAHIAAQLEALGISVTRHTTVGDDLRQLAAVLREAGLRADWVVVTGGLWPTSDDRSAEAAATAAEVTLAFDPEAFKVTERFYRRRKCSRKPGVYTVRCWLFGPCSTHLPIGIPDRVPPSIQSNRSS